MRRRRGCGRRARTTFAWTATSASPTWSPMRSPPPTTSSGSRLARPASPECPWSRARRLASSIGEPGDIPSMPAAAAWSGPSARSPRSWVSRSTTSASSLMTSAATTARETRSIRNSQLSPGRRGAPAGRSNGPRAGQRRWPPTTRRARSPSRPNSRSTPTGACSRSELRTRATSAPTRSRSCRWSRASRSCR